VSKTTDNGLRIQDVRVTLNNARFFCGSLSIYSAKQVTFANLISSST
jgi:hypothetical protein